MLMASTRWPVALALGVVIRGMAEATQPYLQREMHHLHRQDPYHVHSFRPHSAARLRSNATSASPSLPSTPRAPARHPFNRTVLDTHRQSPASHHHCTTPSRQPTSTRLPHRLELRLKLTIDVNNTAHHANASSALFHIPHARLSRPTASMTKGITRRPLRESTRSRMARPNINHNTYEELVPMRPVESKHHHRPHKPHVALASKCDPNITDDPLTLSSFQSLTLDTTAQSDDNRNETTSTLLNDWASFTPSTPSFDITNSSGMAPRPYNEEDIVVPLDACTPPPVRHNRSPKRKTNHKNYDSVRASASHTEGVVSLQDAELSHLFDFVKEIGFGNWGSVWECKPRMQDRHRHSHERLGLASAASGGSGSPGLVAIKLVHRREDSHTPHQIIIQRVRALWGEMKIIHSLRHEPHPNIIRFEAFVITPNYALIVMPYLAERLEVPLPAERAKPYFRQLASAVAYLHERGVCHNDIKPANLQIGYPDVPVLIDFGFAVKYAPGDRGRFLSTSSWGTPEYLDPPRAAGEPHDERKSDVWSLGVTFYEILVGRTPFERDVEEIFETQEDLQVYHQRARTGKWLGHWDIPEDLVHLLRWMIYPNPKDRCTALQAYHHPSLESAFDTDDMTPSVVRHAVNDGQYEDADCSSQEESERSQYERREKVQEQEHRLKAAKSDIGQHKKGRPATPQALVDSIRQVTSEAQLRPKKTFVDRLVECDQENSFVDKRNSAAYPERDSVVTKRRPRVPTPSHAGRVQEQGKQLRVSESQNPALRPVSANAIPQKSLRRISNTVARVASLQPNVVSRQVSDRSTSRSRPSMSPKSSPVEPRTRQEALLRTMRSLEGAPRKLKESTSPAKVGIKRPVSLDLTKEVDRQAALRRSVLLEKVAESEEVYLSPPRAYDPNPQTPVAQISKSRIPPPPVIDVNISTNTVFSRNIGERSFTGKTLDNSTETLDRSELELISRYRAGELPIRPFAILDNNASPARRAKQSTAPDAIGHNQPSDALEDLDRLANWAKSVERYVDDTRRAIAENREPPTMPTAPSSMRGLTSISHTHHGLAPPSQSGESVASGTNRPSSTLVGSWKAPTLSKRHTVSQVFKRFVNHGDKAKGGTGASPGKPARLAPQQSESSIGSRFHTIGRAERPPLSPIAPELDTQEVLSDFGSIHTRAGTPTPNLIVPQMSKPSSMVSLRDKARALLPQQGKTATLPRNLGNLRPDSIHLRPDTPGAASVLSAKKERGERKSILGLFGRRKAAAAATAA